MAPITPVMSEIAMMIESTPLFDPARARRIEPASRQIDPNMLVGAQQIGRDEEGRDEQTRIR